MRKRNRNYFLKKFEKYLKLYNEEIISDEQLIFRLQGWFGYAQWADTYLFRKKMIEKAANSFKAKGSKLLDELSKLKKITKPQGIKEIKCIQSDKIRGKWT